MSIPSCISDAQICSLCDTAQNPSDACTSSGSKNSTSNASACSAYCNTGCNTKCNSAQTYCNLGYEFIKTVGGTYPIKEVCGASNETCGYAQYDRIDITWSAKNWNSLIDNIEKAEKAGSESGQGSGGSATNAVSNKPITMTQYNEIVTKLNSFRNVSISKASRLNNQDIISATKANALRNGYNNAKFKTTVCDVCNAGDEHIGGTCGCNCSCACSCPCGCSCPCPCGCSKPCTDPCTNPCSNPTNS